MGKFSFFKPWTWFASEKRAQIKQQAKPIIGYSGYSGGLTVEPTTPYKNIYYTGSSVVIVFHDGSTLMKNDVDLTLFTGIKECKTRSQIELLLRDKVVEKKVYSQVTETQEERDTVNAYLDILKDNEDFVLITTDRKNWKVFLKDANLELPAVVVGSFIELLERIEQLQSKVDKDAFGADENIDETFEEISQLTEQYEALKMFWYWTAMNPIASARQALFNFIRKNEINLTTNGLLMMYRRIVSTATGSKTTELVEFISNSYLKVKKWKKSAYKYSIIKEDEEYKLIAHTYENGQVLGNAEFIGILVDLYANLHTLQNKTFTDNHTHTKNIKIGTIYKEDEDKIDLDNTQDCSRGLHVGSKSFGFGGYGDTGVLALVNPMYVRSVPVSETNKMRVSEMFIAGEMSVEEYGQDIETQAVADFSNEYCSATLDVLKKAVKDKSYEPITCQGKTVPLGITTEIPSILHHIEQRITEVV